MRLTIVGCSGSMSGPESPASGYLLECDAVGEDGVARKYAITLDFGAGVMGQFLTYLDPAMLDAMLFSHLHADHCSDMVGMQVYRRWYPSGSLPIIDVYAPGDMRQRIIGLSADDPSETYESEFRFHRIAAGSTFDIGPLHVEAFPAQHTIEAVALRITGPSDVRQGEQAVLTFSGDSDLCEGEILAAKDANVLLCEAAFEEGRDTVRGVHLTGKRAGELAAKANADQLLLTHLQPWTDRSEVVAEARSEFDGHVHAVRAGEAFRI